MYTAVRQPKKVSPPTTHTPTHTHTPHTLIGWSALSERDRREKEVFLTGEQRAAKGFMTQASLQLDLLAMMASNDGVVESLLDPQLVRRTTHTVSHCVCTPKVYLFLFVFIC